jgi:hypothetical protein
LKGILFCREVEWRSLPKISASHTLIWFGVKTIGFGRDICRFVQEYQIKIEIEIWTIRLIWDSKCQTKHGQKLEDFNEIRNPHSETSIILLPLQPKVLRCNSIQSFPKLCLLKIQQFLNKSQLFFAFLRSTNVSRIILFRFPYLILLQYFIQSSILNSQFPILLSLRCFQIVCNSQFNDNLIDTTSTNLWWHWFMK